MERCANLNGGMLVALLLASLAFAVKLPDHKFLTRCWPTNIMLGFVSDLKCSVPFGGQFGLMGLGLICTWCRQGSISGCRVKPCLVNSSPT